VVVEIDKTPGRQHCEFVEKNAHQDVDMHEAPPIRVTRTTPRVQVLIPTFERLPYLREAVASVLGQSYGNLLVHVSDNASRDGTADWLASLSDPRLTFSRHEQNLGWLANINSCFASVRGDVDYVSVFHDDDVMHPDFLERSVAMLDAHPSAGLCHSAFDLVGHDGTVIRHRVNWTHGLDSDVLETGQEFIERSMRWSCRVCAPTAVIRRTTLAGRAYDAEDGPCADFGLWLRLALRSDVAFIGDPILSYRVHGATVSAGLAAVEHDGYTFSREMISSLCNVKLGVIDEGAGRLSRTRRMRRTARSVRRASLLSDVGARQPERRIRPTLGSLASAVRIDPSLLVDPHAWRFLVATLVGPRVAGLVRRRLPQAS
jgi:glycosyltransferase involved in cell wall biosynthesis